MTTTIKKTVRGETMEAIFDNCTAFSVRHFIALDLGNPSEYNPKTNYKYEINIRHAENTDANVLFENERFKTEIIN